MFVLSVLVAVLVVRVIGAIDWAAVRGALTKLTWWQPIVLLAVVLVRQVLNALPLALYIRGVSTYKATLNDLGAILMSMIAPPPSDLALRVAMFVSWGVSAAKGLAGTLMNTLTFYVVRFLTPALGFLLLLVLDRPAGLRWLEILFILVALAILAGILLVLRSEALARTVGTRAGQVVRRVRPRRRPGGLGRGLPHLPRRHLRHLPTRVPAFAARLLRDARDRHPGPAAVPAVRRRRTG